MLRSPRNTSQSQHLQNPTFQMERSDSQNHRTTTNRPSLRAANPVSHIKASPADALVAFHRTAVQSTEPAFNETKNLTHANSVITTSKTTGKRTSRRSTVKERFATRRPHSSERWPGFLTPGRRIRRLNSPATTTILL